VATSLSSQDTRRALVLEAGDVPVRPVGAAINGNYLGDEAAVVAQLASEARLDDDRRSRIDAEAARLVEAVRRDRQKKSSLDAFLKKYDLSSQEGVILMCLAEALLRIPDDDTADRLIADKIKSGRWDAHLDDSESLFVNASTWGLLLTGRIVRPNRDDVHDPRGFVQRLAGRLGEPVVRLAFRQAMRIMGHQFVMGRTIDEALERAAEGDNRLYLYSFDMLGEAALTAADSERYFEAYLAGIARLGRSIGADCAIDDAPEISVKLSALHPRYEIAKRRRIHEELGPKIEALARAARAAGVAFTVDAEEADRLELSLELFERVCRSDELAGWNGIGLAVQSYQKRGPAVIEWLKELARSSRHCLRVRLVKGAYWDAEVKRAQERGLTGYPVFTRKVNTDVAYLACARRLIEAGNLFYPQFATHNAHTVATVEELARSAGQKFEFQRLHGMGEELYTAVIGPDGSRARCRVYAPVGSHEDLLPYLVRRLLENGSNTSFVNRIVDEKMPVEKIIEDPVVRFAALTQVANPKIPSPLELFGSERANSRGLNLADGRDLESLLHGMRTAYDRSHSAAPIVDGRSQAGPTHDARNPADRDDVVGSVTVATSAAVDAAIDAAVKAQPAWNFTAADRRAEILEKAADLYEQQLSELVGLCVREAGKTIPDAIAEVREAVDFLRYYAARCRDDFGRPVGLPGPTGESNVLRLEGRGVFVCISPWNFPLAIFTGQVSAALAAGNTVLAKPAEQTPLIAARAVHLLHEAGVPAGVLHFLPGDGAEIGGRAVADPRIAGVAFTGSTETARVINRTLAGRSGAIPALIAETGGQNAMIVDSSALPEQVVLDVVQSGLMSAGQRCSALRVLFVQEDVAPRVLRLLSGFMDQLRVGDPALLATDIGPVIDDEARAVLEAHAQQIVAGARWQHRYQLGRDLERGCFFAPLAVEIDGLSRLEREVFGPIVHVVRYSASHVDDVIDAINATGYGLTLGVHTRIDSFARHVAARVNAGNVYVNRNMVGAVVGVQPFGGRGLSGTGPKAGGPHYLHRFATERTVTINTAAVGGNASLLALGGDE
jgi:RHH-type proline utilization regulon transcriptional repressor/proline dehydrogenase/delta 1-pyrroline-5-carboxylate dehydrogenase